MSFNGNLEDIAIADVLQLLHATRKSGTLRVTSDDKEGCITFKDGDIISANHPNKEVNIGTLLLQMKAIKPDDLTVALVNQSQVNPVKPLIALLIERGCLQRDVAWQALKKLIEQTAVDLVSWNQGEFLFDMDQVKVFDDYRYFPENLKEEFNLDTQMVLMEALRIFDERNNVREKEIKKREAEGADPGAKAHFLNSEVGENKPTAAQILDKISAEEETALLTSLDSGSTKDESILASQIRIFILFTKDAFLKSSIKTLCEKSGIDLYIYYAEFEIFKMIRQCLAEKILPAVVVDTVTEDNHDEFFKKGLGILKRIKDDFPEIPVIQMVPPNHYPSYSLAFELGARAVLPKPLEGNKRKDFIDEMKHCMSILQSCLRGIFREQNGMIDKILTIDSQMAVLRHHVCSFQSNKEYADLSLVLLQFVAETLNRAIIFLVRREDMIGIGEFGIELQGKDKSLAAMHLKISLQKPSIFRRAIESAKVFYGEEKDSQLEEYLFKEIGCPLSPEILLLPLKASNRTVALIYGDFGEKAASPINMDSLEILASQAGLAMENALFRKQLEKYQVKT